MSQAEVKEHIELMDPNNERLTSGRRLDWEMSGGLSAQSLVRQVTLQQEYLAHAVTELAGALELLSEEVGAEPPEQYAAGRLAERTVVRCLGTFEVQIGPARVENWRSGKARSLFEYLVTHGNRPIARETLIEALWPDPDALAAGTSLKVSVHALRQVLQAVTKTGQCSAPVILAHESGYQLQAPDLWLDVDEFERLYALGRRLEGQSCKTESLTQYARAVELYHGDFLSDSWSDWVVFRREGLKDQYLAVLARLADAALAEGDYHGCILRCRQLLEGDRCREDTFRTLMVCHARLGQPSRLRRWYELCVTTLRAELDVEPEPETSQLYHQLIDRSQKALRFVRLDGPSTKACDIATASDPPLNRA